MGDGTPQEPVSTAAKKNRPLFQFHLSTAIVLMFVAAGLLWMNLNPRRDMHHADVGYLGWPVWFHVRDLNNALFHWWRLIANLLLNVMLLVALGVVCEWRIRRRERRHD